LRDVLDDLLAPGALPVSVDPARIVLSGHGLGGKVALMAASGDVCVRALFVFDPINAGGPGGYTAEQPNIVPQPVGSLAVPIGLLGELLDSTSGAGQACAPAAVNYQTMFQAATASPRAYEWTLAGASHIDFVTNQDQCGFACTFCNPRTLPLAQTHAFMRASAVAFLRTYLQGESGLCPWLTGVQVPGAVAVRQAPPP
jgi:Chlorophyllase enzyme